MKLGRNDAAGKPKARAKLAQVLAATCVLAAASFSSCSGGRGRRPPTLVWLITLDTVRADAPSFARGPRGLTPMLDALAEEGLVFERARTCVPLTLPAHASMLTGLYPPRHGIRDNGHAPLSRAARTLAELARERGWQTAAVVAATVMDRLFALDQGFEIWSQPERAALGPTGHYAEWSARTVAERALQVLAERDRARPLLLWTHFFDAHVPYAPPPAELARAGGDPYLGELAAIDGALATIRGALERAAIYDDALILALGDHGEARGEHGEQTHGALCYEGTLRVPFVLRDGTHRPSQAERLRARDRLASVVDVMPTLAARMGLSVPADLDGLDLCDPLAARAGVYFESYSGWLNYGWAPLSGFADEQYKYLHSARPELYQPALDPAEERDLASEFGALCEPYELEIARVAARSALPQETPQGTPGALLRELRLLGYAATGGPIRPLPHPLDVSVGRVPRDNLEELDRLLLANSWIEGGRFPEAIAALEWILARNPEHLLALDYLGIAQLNARQPALARDALERRLSLGHERSDTRINLGLAWSMLGEEQRAQAQFAAALALDPFELRARRELADSLRRSGKHEEAARVEAAQPRS
jgi:arylsulfatase A-like enzyme